MVEKSHADFRIGEFEQFETFQVKTFLFDRKGNFAMPSAGELTVLEQRGWIKLIAD